MQLILEQQKKQTAAPRFGGEYEQGGVEWDDEAVGRVEVTAADLAARAALEVELAATEAAWWEEQRAWA